QLQPSPLPYTTLFRSATSYRPGPPPQDEVRPPRRPGHPPSAVIKQEVRRGTPQVCPLRGLADPRTEMISIYENLARATSRSTRTDRKSTRLNSSHGSI